LLGRTRGRRRPAGWIARAGGRAGDEEWEQDDEGREGCAFHEIAFPPENGGTLKLPATEADLKQRKLLKTVTEFGGYIRANGVWIPNYGERYRYGEAISSSFVESTVNQVVSKRMVKKQQMRWTPEGAHLLLQTRTRTLNGDLAATFRTWYPACSLDDRETTDNELPAAA
jgi:hypothetical protein